MIKININSILLFFALLIFNNVSAQNNLQFSRVVNEKLSGAVANNTQITKTVTVPVGKIWKIESASINYNDGASVYAFDGVNYIYFSIGDFALSAGSSAQHSPYMKYPIWLPEGTYTMILRNQGVSATDIRGIISVLEFNVVP